jgi:uncharacterized protein YdeI (YjbR/CyaY-like superfamily)
MGTKDKRVDLYIAKSADFAKPILLHLRELVHKACPAVEEKMKWSFPHFDYKGMMCSMAAFKEHCAFGFWKATLMKDAHKFGRGNDAAMGHLGKITSLDQVPSDKTLLAYIKEAMKLNDDGVKLPPRQKVPNEKKVLVVPDYLKKALSKNKKAHQQFTAFSYSKKRDYIEYLTEARTEDTRVKRLSTAIEWIAEGKGRNWKYER